MENPLPKTSPDVINGTPLALRLSLGSRRTQDPLRESTATRHEKEPNTWLS